MNHTEKTNNENGKNHNNSVRANIKRSLAVLLAVFMIAGSLPFGMIPAMGVSAATAESPFLSDGTEDELISETTEETYEVGKNDIASEIAAGSESADTVAGEDAEYSRTDNTFAAYGDTTDQTSDDMTGVPASEEKSNGSENADTDLYGENDQIDGFGEDQSGESSQDGQETQEDSSDESSQDLQETDENQSDEIPQNGQETQEDPSGESSQDLQETDGSQYDEIPQDGHTAEEEQYEQSDETVLDDQDLLDEPEADSSEIEEPAIPDGGEESGMDSAAGTDNNSDISSDAESSNPYSEATIDAGNDVEESDIYEDTTVPEPDVESGSETASEDALNETINNGYCGDNVTWTLDNDGTLLIDGEGEMYNYGSKASPFYSMDQVTAITICDGVSSIGEYAFNGCINLNTVNIPVSVASIGEGAFTDCSMLKEFYFSGTQEEWNTIAGGDVYTSLGANLYVIDNPSPVAISLKDCSISPFESKTYTGEELFQDFYIEYGDTVLSEGNDYRVKYSDNINAGTASVVITGTGHYTDSVKKLFRIKPRSITPTVSLSKTSFVYNGKTQKPVVTVKDGDITLSDTDYSLSYPSGMQNAGSYTISVELKGNYSGSKTLTYSITAKKITPELTLSTSSYVYSGTVRKPSITVKDGNTKLAASNYTVTYGNGRKNVGTYTVSVKLKGNYSGSGKVTFKINRKKITPKITLSKSSFVYNGKVQKPSITVKDGNTKLGTSCYTVTYPEGMKNAGTYKIIVRMKGNYSGAKSAAFRIVPKKITPSVKLNKTVFVFNGKTQKPVVTVKIGNTKQASSKYTLTWSKNLKAVGTHTVTVKLKGNYSGSKKLSFKVNPPATSIQKAIGSYKQVTVTWVKKAQQVSGYQIQYSSSPKFASGNKIITVPGCSNTSKTFDKPAAGKNYNVRIRTYKKVGTKTYYSKWSPAAYTAIKQVIKAKNNLTNTHFTFTTRNSMMFIVSLDVTPNIYVASGGIKIILKDSDGNILQNDLWNLEGIREGNSYTNWFYNDNFIIPPGTYTYIIQDTTGEDITVKYSILGYLKKAVMATIKKEASVKSGYWVKVGNFGEGCPLFKDIVFSDSSIVAGWHIENDGTIWFYGDKKGKATVTMTLYDGKKYTCNVNVTAGNPNFFAYLSGYYTRDNYFEVKVKNLRPSPVTIIRTGAHVEDVDYKSYDRNIKSADRVTVKSGETKYIRFYVDGDTTWPDVDDFTLCAKIEYEGITYDWHVWDNDSVYKKNGGWYDTYWTDYKTDYARWY